MRYSRSDENGKGREWGRRTLLWKCGGKEDVRQIDNREGAES